MAAGRGKLGLLRVHAPTGESGLSSLGNAVWGAQRAPHVLWTSPSGRCSRAKLANSVTALSARVWQTAGAVAPAGYPHSCGSTSSGQRPDEAYAAGTSMVPEVLKDLRERSAMVSARRRADRGGAQAL